MAKKMVRIYSNEHSVSHEPTSDKIGREWKWVKNPYEKDCYIDVEADHFRHEMRNSIGFRRLFTEDAVLFIKDEALVEEWGLEDIQEYILDVDSLTDLVFNGTLTELEDYLMYAPQSMIDNIEVICTTTELTDTKKIRLIHSYTGKNLGEFYEDLQAEGQVVGDITKPKARQPRVKREIK